MSADPRPHRLALYGCVADLVTWAGTVPRPGDPVPVSALLAGPAYPALAGRSGLDVRFLTGPRETVADRVTGFVAAVGGPVTLLLELPDPGLEGQVADGLRGLPVELLCLCDAAGGTPAVLRSARSAHPDLAVPGGGHRFDFRTGLDARLRMWLRALLAGAELPPPVGEELDLVVYEAARTAREAGDPAAAVALRVGVGPGERIVAEVPVAVDLPPLRMATLPEDHRLRALWLAAGVSPSLDVTVAHRVITVRHRG